MSVLRINCLGTFQVQWAGQPVERFDTLKNRALLAYLALEGGSALSRDFLAGLLWPDFPNAIALRNLRLALFNLRQTFTARQGGSAEEPGPIVSSRLAVQINPKVPVWVDVKAFEGLFDQVRRHVHSSLEDCPACIEKLQAAVAAYSGDFLEGFALKDCESFMEWLALRRAYLQQMMLDGLDQLGRYSIGLAERAVTEPELLKAAEGGLTYARRALQIEPVRESAHLQAVKALALQGKKQEALAQAEACRKVLRAELDVDPEEGMLRLCEQIRAEAYPLRPAIKIGGRTQPRSRFALPAQLTPLIGRAAQLERLTRLLFSYRWVTLVGEGGVGKSRLAVAAAEQVGGRFCDGTLFVSLEGVGAIQTGWEDDRQAAQEAILQAVAAAFELRAPEDVSIERLCALVDQRKILLILDSFEHLSSGADILLELLMRAPNLHILVTTRQSLYFQAGCMMRIDGLPVPTADLESSGEQFAAVQLFLERVGRLYGDYRPGSEELPWIIRICRLLDGIPLAIELAAPWVNKLPLVAIASAIEHDLDFLANSMPGLLERHHSMRVVFESSWTLLKPAEKWTLACCAAFKNGFTYDEIFALCQASFHEVEGLVDKNLVIRVEPKQYRMHEILRQFVLEKSLDVQPFDVRPRAETRQAAFSFAAPFR